MGRTTMNRWALQRCAKAEVWLRTRVERASAGFSARAAGGRDSGQTSFEYLGIAVVIAVIIGILATTSIGDAVQQAILDAIDKITGK